MHQISVIFIPTQIYEIPILFSLFYIVFTPNENKAKHNL